MHTELPPIYYIIFTGVTAAGVLLEAFVLLAMYIGLRQTTRKLHKATDELREHALPAIATARNLLELNLVDEVLPEPLGGAHNDKATMTETVKKHLVAHLKALEKLSPAERLKQRYQRFRNHGHVVEKQAA